MQKDINKPKIDLKVNSVEALNMLQQTYALDRANHADLFSRLERNNWEVTIKESLEGKVIITGTPTQDIKYAGVNFVYSFDPETQQGDFIFDLNQNGVIAKGSLERFALNKPQSAKITITQLSQVLALTESELYDKLPRVREYSKDLYINLTTHTGKISINAQGQTASEIEFIYELDLSNFEAKLVYAKSEKDPTTGMRKIYAAWNEATFRNFPRPTRDEINVRAKVFIKDAFEIPAKERDKFYLKKIDDLKDLLSQLEQVQHLETETDYLYEGEGLAERIQERTDNEHYAILMTYYPGYSISDLQSFINRLPLGISKQDGISMMARNLILDLRMGFQVAKTVAEREALKAKSIDSLTIEHLKKAFNFKMPIISQLSAEDLQFLLTFLKANWQVPPNDIHDLVLKTYRS